MNVEILVHKDGYEVRTSMAMEDGYPLMRIDSVAEIDE
jgi:hypothetical protein